MTPDSTSLTVGDGNRLATAQARCARWGGALVASEDDAGRLLLVISRGAHERSFSSLDEVESFLAVAAGFSAGEA